MPDDFLTGALPLFGAVVIGVIVILYAVYLSLSVRRGLVDPVFRSRALWMSLFGVPLVVALTNRITTYELLPTDYPLAAPIISDALFTFAIVAFFIWIDRMVVSVIRLDFLRKDILSWRKYRLAYYAILVIANGFYFGRYLGLSSGALLSAVTLVISAGYGLLALVRGTRVTRDSTFKSHMRWFGLMGIAFSSGLVLFAVTLHPSLGLGVPFLAVSFCFYKMAKHLVPTNKLGEGQRSRTANESLLAGPGARP